jgi:putative ABC transport system permease protein
MQYGHWKDGEITRALTAIDPETIGEVAAVDMVEGSLGRLQGGGIVLAEHLANELGLGVGDTLPMTFSRTGEQQIQIVGLVDDNDAQALTTDYLISLDTYSQLYSESMDASVFVRIASDVSAAEAEAAIEDALADYPTVEISDQAAAAEGRTRTVDQILGLVTVLLMLALAIALLGITNTLALSVIERTREIGLLRAVGMARSQLGSMIQGEALLVTVLAVILGTSLGSAFGVSTVLALSASAPISLEIPADRLVLLAGVTAAAGLLAGLLPAKRAGNLDVLRAIAQN